MRQSSAIAFAPLVLASTLALGCTAPDDDVDSVEDDIAAKTPSENWARDILTTRLEVDVAHDRASAMIEVAPSTRTGASFEVEGLTVHGVHSATGPVPYRVDGGRLDVALAAKKPVSLTIDYDYREQSGLEGATKSGLTFLWPSFCGNLFPCKSEPKDGLRFALEIGGIPPGKRAIYPQTIPADAPSYMVAWAIGDYTTKQLGTTKAGTNVSVHYLPGGASAATKGTAHLVAVFDWYEQTYGAYLFGNDVGSVAAAWGAGAFGGMEHHPYWHVATDAMSDEETHAHEAAHGWFGDGVRLACWEDLTLSEGTVSYLAARGLEAVAGAGAGSALWSSYASRLASVVKSEDRIAWPKATCNEIDVIHDLWNDVVYMKGAFFYRAVEKQIGQKALDRAIARFYAEQRGKAASMSDMLVTIQLETGFDAAPLAAEWLEKKGAPKLP